MKARGWTLTIILARPRSVAFPWIMRGDGEDIAKDGQASRAWRGRRESRAAFGAIYITCKHANEGGQHNLDIDGTIPHPVLQSLSQVGLSAVTE